LVEGPIFAIFVVEVREADGFGGGGGGRSFGWPEDVIDDSSSNCQDRDASYDCAGNDPGSYGFSF
jgi:hypothetical protein